MWTISNTELVGKNLFRIIKHILDIIENTLYLAYFSYFRIHSILLIKIKKSYILLISRVMIFSINNFL